jgi:hypothetical protein
MAVQNHDIFFQPPSCIFLKTSFPYFFSKLKTKYFSVSQTNQKPKTLSIFEEKNQIRRHLEFFGGFSKNMSKKGNAQK